ncbi:MAG: hypothetical protein ACXWDL_05095 [Nocardioides sp.]
MTPPPPVATRRGVLLGAATTLLVGCTGGVDPPDAPPTSPPTRLPEEPAIFDLSFEPVSRTRPFALLAPGFLAVDTGPVVGPAAGGDLVLAEEGPPAPFAAVELRIDGARGSAAAGLASPGGDHVLVRWSAETARITLEVRTGGRTRVLRRRTVRLRGAFGLAFVVCENQVTALVDEGDGWQPVLTERTKVAALVDLAAEETLTGLRYAWSRTGARVRSVRAGLFGLTGVRDPHLVQRSDGRPYVRDGRYYMTWTCAGPGFFQQAHWTVWSFDPAEPGDQRLEAQLFTRRDGRILGDHAGQVVRDGRRWLVATSSWGDFTPGTIHVRHTTTTADVLSGVHVLDTEPTPLPTEYGSWDPAMTRIDGAWHVGYVESPSQDPFDFHPALATTRSATWHEDLAPAAAATTLHQTEGPILVRVVGESWLLASDGDARNYPVFDLTGRRVGRVDAPYPTNIPHPQLVPAPDGGWWLVTFDGTPYAEPVLGYGTHGDLIVMRAG